MRQVISIDGPRGKVAFETESDGLLLDTSAGDRVRSAVGNLVDGVNDTILGCYASVSQAANAIIQDASTELKSIEISFGIKLSAEGNIFVAKGSTEANLTIKLAWQR